MNQSNITEDVKALRTAAGFLIRPELYTLVFAGKDRVRFLNGMVTNDVAKLQPGDGQLAVKATSRGRVEGLLRVRCLADALHVDVLEASAQNVANSMAQMIIMEDVTLADGTDARVVIGLYGPKAVDVLRGLDLPVPAASHSFQTKTTESGASATVVRDAVFGPDGYELHVEPGEADAWRSRLVEAGVRPVGRAAFEVVRVEQGRPTDGVDIDPDTIPMEARLDAALDFKKGCFVGQEVIARAHNLGGVKHILVGLTFEGGDPPPVGARLIAETDGKSTGEVTSVVMSPTLGRPIGLGFVRIAHQTPGTGLVVRAGPDESAATVGRAEVTSLPIAP